MNKNSTVKFFLLFLSVHLFTSLQIVYFTMPGILSGYLSLFYMILFIFGRSQTIWFVFLYCLVYLVYLRGNWYFGGKGEAQICQTSPDH